MAQSWKLVFDVQGGVFGKNLTDSSPYVFPSAYHGEMRRVDLTLVNYAPESGGTKPYSLIDPNGYSVRCSIVSLDLATVLARQTSFAVSADGTYLTGILSLNTTELNNYLGANLSAQAYLVIKVTSADTEYVIRKPIIIEKSGDDATTPDPIEIDTFLTATQMAQIYLKRNNDEGVTCTFNKNGHSVTIGANGNDGSFQVDSM